VGPSWWLFLEAEMDTHFSRMTVAVAVVPRRSALFFVSKDIPDVLEKATRSTVDHPQQAAVTLLAVCC
jgi:hypothetical protein